MQSDWATIRCSGGKMSVFVATLSWSRAAYVEFCEDERIETLLRCHEYAFAICIDHRRLAILDPTLSSGAI